MKEQHSASVIHNLNLILDTNWTELLGFKKVKSNFNQNDDR